MASDDTKHVPTILRPSLRKDTILCADGSRILAAAAKQIGGTHHRVNLPTGIGLIAGIYHGRNVSAYERRLKGCTRRFKGVATRYLDTSVGIAPSTGPAVVP